MKTGWVLIKRRSCQPCEKMESYLRSRLAHVPDALEILDVDSNGSLKQVYGLRVPVLLHQGRIMSEGKWEVDRIEESLKQAGY
ncbi:MAG: glutaredoxin family protein [Gammaproteobacteria bacterium]